MPNWEIQIYYSRTISASFKQAKNVIIDTRRTKLKDEFIEKSITVVLKKRPSIKKVILINKLEKVVEILS